MRTRGARGGLNLNRTLGQSPRHRLADSAETPKEKTLLRVFFFRGSALQVFGQCGGAKCELGFAKNIFWGKGFGKTSTDFCCCVCPRGGGVWGGIRAGCALI